MSESIAYKKSFELAIEIVTYCKWLKESKHEYEMAKQLIRSGTSIGANLAEANGAISINDFSNKVSIAYKECLETKYWLQLLEATNNIESQTYNNLYTRTDEIAKILFSILKTTRINKTGN